MPDIHARLSASSALRWLNCPPSVALTAAMPDTSSEYAAEGTLAHKLAELKLRKKFELMSKRVYSMLLEKITSDPLYQKEMDTHTTTYLDEVVYTAHSYKSIKPYVAIERQVDYSGVAPEGFGTCDCIMICGDDLHIFDFKYGKGVPVSPDENPQLMLYAIGALQEYALLYAPTNAVLHIVQPRISNTASWTISTADLTAWGNKVKPTAQLAYTGGGEYKSGKWCRFCKASAACRKRTEEMFAAASETPTPAALMTDAELGAVLEKADDISHWAKSLQDYALSEILAGRKIDGWKAVEGRSNRAIQDLDAAFDKLRAAGYADALLYERKPLTLTQLEDMITAPKLSELIGDHIRKPRGKPALAPASDKRKDYTDTAVADMFGDENK